MRRFIRKIYQKIDWILIMVGSYMIACGIFDFSTMGGSGLRLLSGEKTVYAYEYYYDDGTQLMIALGVVLLVLGVLIYKEKRHISK